MNPASSLLTKILGWFFLNILLVAAILALFFAFQPHIDLHAVFGQPGAHRLRTAGKLIAHDLSHTHPSNWSGILSRHAEIHGVGFTVVSGDGAHFSSSHEALPRAVEIKIREMLRHKPPEDRFPPPRGHGGPRPGPPRPRFAPPGEPRDQMVIPSKPPIPPEKEGGKPLFRMRTQQPNRYWSGIRIRLAPISSPPPPPAVLLAVSDSMTGNGFFFDPLPWMVVVTAVILISVLFWIPMIRNISRPLGRMTRATEKISKGRFDVAIHEPRSDEIGRLAQGINHMTSRLTAFVKGQKRFLGDVSHELGSPIARIQFGLGALEQRVEEKNRQRVADVMEDVDQLSALVNELLAFSRADMTSKAVKLESIDLLPVVNTAVKRETAPEAHIIVDIDPTIRVVASTELLTRALANLARNAVKYAESAGPIEFTAQKNGNIVEIKVRDNGPGVPEDSLDQLFEPFFRPEASRNRESGGVGLGLAIVKTCIEACKGTVIAHNCKPSGFTVTISLPG